MKASICDRCSILNDIVLATWKLPMQDKISGKVSGDLCTPHMNEAKIRFKPGQMQEYLNYLVGKDITPEDRKETLDARLTMISKRIETMVPQTGDSEEAITFRADVQLLQKEIEALRLRFVPKRGVK